MAVRPFQRLQEVDLVEDQYPGLVQQPKITKYLLYHLGVLSGVGVGDIEHVQYQRRFLGLLEGGPERRHDRGRQLLYESHRIGQQHVSPLGSLDAPRDRVEGREKLILGRHSGTRQLV